MKRQSIKYEYQMITEIIKWNVEWNENMIRPRKCSLASSVNFSVGACEKRGRLLCLRWESGSRENLINHVFCRLQAPCLARLVTEVFMRYWDTQALSLMPPDRNVKQKLIRWQSGLRRGSGDNSSQAWMRKWEKQHQWFHGANIQKISPTTHIISHL